MNLTDRQSAIRDYIRDYCDVRGYSPSLRDIGVWFGISSEGVRRNLQALEAKGAIRRDPGVPRSIVVVDARQPTAPPA